MLTTYHRILANWRNTTMAKHDPYTTRLLIELEELRRLTKELEAETVKLQARLERQAVKDTVRGMENQ